MKIFMSKNCVYDPAANTSAELVKLALFVNKDADWVLLQTLFKDALTEMQHVQSGVRRINIRINTMPVAVPVNIPAPVPAPVAAPVVAAPTPKAPAPAPKPTKKV